MLTPTIVNVHRPAYHARLILVSAGLHDEQQRAAGREGVLCDAKCDVRTGTTGHLYDGNLSVCTMRTSLA